MWEATAVPEAGAQTPWSASWATDEGLDEPPSDSENPMEPACLSLLRHISPCLSPLDKGEGQRLPGAKCQAHVERRGRRPGTQAKSRTFHPTESEKPPIQSHWQLQLALPS